MRSTLRVWQDRGWSGRAIPDPLADDGGDAVLPHRDAVEGIRDLHRALLVRDDDELRVGAQVFHDREQAAEVGVVERRLHLVHDVERAGARLEDRHQQRDRRERPLATGEQREPLDLLARGLHRHLDAGGEHVLGVGKMDAATAAREQHREDLVERVLGVFERRPEDVLHLLVDLVDDRQQVLAGRGEVGELLGEEPVPLLERLELLERQRVHSAELAQLALRRREAGLLLGADERDGAGLLRRITFRRLGVERLVDRHRHLGAVLGDEHLFVERQILGGALEQRREVQLLLVGLHLEPVHVLVEGAEPLAQRALGAAEFVQLLVLLAARGLGGGELDPGLRDGAVGDIQGRGKSRDDLLRRFDLVLALHGDAGGLLGGGALGLELRLQRVGLLALRAHPLAGGLEFDPRLHLGGTRGFEFGVEGVARRDVEDELYSRNFSDAETFFMADDQIRFNASLLLMSNIGEYCSRISDELKTKYATVAWRQIKGLRNRIAHDYTGIDYEMVFDIIQNDLPKLKESFENILKQELVTGFFDIAECEIARQSIFYKHVDFDKFLD